jgi:hypothetical protein
VDCNAYRLELDGPSMRELKTASDGCNTVAATISKPANEAKK